MEKIINVTLSPEEAFEEAIFRQCVLQNIGEREEDIVVRPLKRSIDARSRKVKVNVTAAVYIKQAPPPLISYRKDYSSVHQKQRVIIVGAGPAGLFAALRCVELGLKPIVIERGKDVKRRRRDLAAINKAHLVNPDSNYCFGEGGAGTYSDGKLYTRSKKRGDVKRILEILVAHGAAEDILVDAHPHIGTNKLPKIITAIRESILHAGGEILFDSKVTDFIIREGEVRGVVTEKGDKLEGIGVILATGHSARDIFTVLQDKGVMMEIKPFALGIRIEHPQQLIDKIQYKVGHRGPYLPASSYALVCQTQQKGVEKGVFSFCMCPGGFIVPSATSPGEVVVNGMSPSRRDSRFANSGIVVAVDAQDFKPYASFGALAGMVFQRETEQKACLIAGGTQAAPAQRMVDFVEGRLSSSLPDTSYQPGLVSSDLRQVLPVEITRRLQEAFKVFGKKMKGYLTNDAQVIGVESRTSSPVKIPRSKETFEHLQLRRFYPCGEGAGYAGGIVSAAMDGERCAEKLAKKYGGVTISI